MAAKLMLEVGVTAGHSYTFVANLLAQILSGSLGTVDFGDTAPLFIGYSGEPILSPSDSRFLSQAAFNPDAVPLLAALPLFASGLAILGSLSRRRNKRIAATDA